MGSLTHQNTRRMLTVSDITHSNITHRPGSGITFLDYSTTVGLLFVFRLVIMNFVILLLAVEVLDIV